MKGIGAVIFDFNGVLVDDESVHFELFRELLAQRSVVITERDYHDRYLGYDDRGCFEAALLDAGQTVDRERLDELIAQKARRYVEVAAQGLRFFPGAPEILEAVGAQWPIAICSGALRPEIEFALGQVGRRERVAAIISAEDTKRGKPDPEGYQLALAALRSRTPNQRLLDSTIYTEASPQLDAVNCIVIEDSLAGIIAAKRAGMKAVGVPHTYSIEQLKEAGADEIVDQLAVFTPEWIQQRFAS